MNSFSEMSCSDSPCEAIHGSNVGIEIVAVSELGQAIFRYIPRGGGSKAVDFDTDPDTSGLDKAHRRSRRRHHPSLLDRTAHRTGCSRGHRLELRRSRSSGDRWSAFPTQQPSAPCREHQAQACRWSLRTRLERRWLATTTSDASNAVGTDGPCPHSCPTMPTAR